MRRKVQGVSICNIMRQLSTSQLKVSTTHGMVGGEFAPLVRNSAASWRGCAATAEQCSDFDPLCRLREQAAATFFPHGVTPPDTQGHHMIKVHPVVPCWQENSSRKKNS
jgi:hypothetical protein